VIAKTGTFENLSKTPADVFGSTTSRGENNYRVEDNENNVDSNKEHIHMYYKSAHKRYGPL